MQQEFLRIYTKYMRRALIAGGAAGVLGGAAVTGALLLAFKLCAVEWGWYLYLAVFLAVAALCFLAAYLILLPREFALARKLDRVYSLDERVQTMAEFSADGGEMAVLQREDAADTLKNLPRRRSAGKAALASAAAALAVALFAAGIAVEQKPTAEPEPEPPYTVPTAALEALTALIENVEGDGALPDGVKELYTAALNALYSGLTGDDLSEELTAAYVQSTMYTISSSTIGWHTYDEFAYSLSSAYVNNTDEGAPLEALASALRSCAAALGDITISSYGALTALYDSLPSILYGYTETAGEALASAVTALDDSTLKTTLTLYSSALQNGLKADGTAACCDLLCEGLSFGDRRGEATSGNALYDAVYDFYYSISRYLVFYDAGTYSASKVTESLAGATSAGGDIYTLTVNVTEAMQPQAYVYCADNYIRNALAKAFGVEAVGYTPEDGSSLSASAGGDESGAGGAGGGGSGKELYPTQADIYNPETGEYTFYIEMYNDYYTAYLQDLLAGDEVSDETKAYIWAYLNSILAKRDEGDSSDTGG